MKDRLDWKIFQVYSLMFLFAAVLLGCTEQSETEVPVIVEDDGSIELAFACAPSAHSGTRLDDMIIQQNDLASGANYRRIDNFHFVSFKKESDIIRSLFISDYGKEQVPENKTSFRYYHFGYCNMPQEANGFLVYAKAQDVAKSSIQQTSVYNGNLHVVVPDYVTSTSDIYAEPVSIISDAAVGEDGIPAEAWILADALTDIANIENWSTMNDNNLKPLLAHFTNYGYDLAGSASCVSAWIGALKKTAEDMGSLGDGQVGELIRQEIISKASDFLDPENEDNIVGLSYPQNINLPDGAAVLRWTEVEEGGTKVKKFVPQLRTTTLDDINSVSFFVYPAALYYFVESGIWTSNSKVTFDQYKGRSNWKGNGDDAVQTLFQAGGTITGSTKTVAIADPLQYAVARLQLTVEVDADVAELKYNGTNTIPYKNDEDVYNFRMTGVIVGGQRKVGYDFKPIAQSDDDVKFVYDSQVGDSYYLKKKSEYAGGTVDPANTLVLQTCDNEDVNVILEFEYTGDTEFKCLNGYVYPGTRFYLVGVVKSADFKDETGDEASRGRVFTQDYTTTIEMTVKSLEKAYNVLPNIIAKNLEIGVMTTPKWKAATPQDAIIME